MGEKESAQARQFSCSVQLFPFNKARKHHSFVVIKKDGKVYKDLNIENYVVSLLKCLIYIRCAATKIIFYKLKTTVTKHRGGALGFVL